MTQEEAVRYIDAYIDNELDVKDALEIQGWIEKDEVCRTEYERILALKEMLRGKLGEEGPGASNLLKHRVRKAIRREGLRQTVWFRPSVAAAAVITFLVLGWAGYHDDLHGGDGEPPRCPIERYSGRFHLARR